MGILTDRTDFPVRSVKTVGILTDLANIGDFSARSVGTVRILTDLTDVADFGEIKENGGNPHRPIL